MKKKLTLEIAIPEGIECRMDYGHLKCKKGDVEVSKEIVSPGMKVEVAEGKIKLICEKGNKRDKAKVGANASHVKNMLSGLDEKYVYELEICHVHFPMTAKVEGSELVIDNFLGEKQKRRAKILKGVEVEVKGNKVMVLGHDIESAGQTAANIERATKVPKKDRRIFQDGIFMTMKRGREL